MKKFQANNFFFINVDFLICFCISISFVSCKTQEFKFNPANHAIKAAEGEKKYISNARLRPGSKYYYKFDNNTRTTFEINEAKKNVTNRFQIGLIYEIVKDSASFMIVRIRYDKIHITSKDQDKEEENIDADDAADAFDSMQKILSYIKSATIDLTVDSSGKIIKSQGGKDIDDKIFATLQANDPVTKNKIRQLLKQFSGEGFMNTDLTQSLKILPDSGVYIGDSWEKENAEAGMLDFKSKTKFVLQSVNDNAATISIEGLIFNPGNGKMNLMGSEFTTNLEGNQTGEITADPLTGMIKSSRIKTTIEGDIQAMNKDVPLTINIEKNIAVKKIN